jgi:hypothetical protein
VLVSDLIRGYLTLVRGVELYNRNFLRDTIYAPLCSVNTSGVRIVDKAINR